LQDLRENMRQQTSSQFSRQMRDLRSQARDLASHEEQIAQDLDKLSNSGQKQLDDTAPRTALTEQMARQQSALTNLLAQMQTVTEQAESTEPLLSKQLYDILRRTDQAHTESQLEMSGRLLDRGFLPQAGEAEKAARQNLDELKQNVDRAAESVLGSETDALRYAQKQLDDLASQLAKDLATRTNGAPGKGASRQGTRRGETQPGTAQPGGTQPGGTEQAGAQEGGSSTNGAGATAGASANQSSNPSGQPGGTGGQDALSQFARQLGAAGGAGGLGENGPITGNNFIDWSDRLRDVEQAVDSQDVRNQLATVRERVGVYRRAFRQNGQLPPPGELQNKALAPLALARDWVGEELSRAQNDRSLVPLDRDPVQDKYSDLVRKYYEKLGSPQ
jgi:hypothetical protein